MIPVTPELINGMDRMGYRMDDNYNFVRDDAKKPPSKRQGDKVWVTDPRAKGGGYWRKLKPGSGQAAQQQGGGRLKTSAEGGGKKKGGGLAKTVAILAAGGVGAVLAARAGVKEIGAQVISRQFGIPASDGRKMIKEAISLDKSLKKEYAKRARAGASPEELQEIMQKGAQATEDIYKKYVPQPDYSKVPDFKNFER